MTIFTPNEIAGCIYLVGDWGPGNKDKAPAFLDIAIAVCLAESSGKDDAHNPPATKNPDGSYNVPATYAVGLWQIMYPTHKDLLNKYASQYSTNPGLTKSYTHPLVNTACARDLQKTQGWTPWEVYTKGSYKRYLGHGTEAYAWLNKKENLVTLRAKLAEYGGNYSPPSVGVDTSWQDVLKALPSYLIDKLKDMGITVGIFLIGAILVILGVWFLLSRSIQSPQKKLLKQVLK